MNDCTILVSTPSAAKLRPFPAATDAAAARPAAAAPWRPFAPARTRVRRASADTALHAQAAAAAAAEELACSSCSGPLSGGPSRGCGAVRRTSCCAEMFARLAAPPQAMLIADQTTQLCCRLFEVSAAVIMQAAPAEAPQAPRGGSEHRRAVAPLAASAARLLSLSGCEHWPVEQTVAVCDVALRAAAARCVAVGAPPGVLAACGADVTAVSGGRAAFVAAAPLVRDGVCGGAIILLDQEQRSFSKAHAALLLQIAALASKDLGQPPGSCRQQPLINDSATSHPPAAGASGDAGDGDAGPLAAAAVVRPPPAAAGGAWRPSPHAGTALVDTAAPGCPLLLSDHLFSKFTGAEPCGAAAAEGLWQLLGLPPAEAARCAAAARARVAFEISAVTHRLGGAVHLRARFAPCPAPAAATAADAAAPAAPSNGGAIRDCGGGSGGAAALYLVAVDFLNASDTEMWAPGGAPRPFRLLDAPPPPP